MELVNQTALLDELMEGFIGNSGLSPSFFEFIAIQKESFYIQEVIGVPHLHPFINKGLNLSDFSECVSGINMERDNQ
jgi:hypothetical protein